MYKGRYFVRERIYICGDYMDADIFPVYQPAGKRRKKCKPTSAIQARLNQKNASRHLTRIVHNNFTGEDLALHLTWDEEPESVEAACRALYNYIRRIKNRRRKLGLPALKYISCTETGSERGRIHHHLIISGGMDRDELEELWGHGLANSKRLQFGDDGVTGLAHYMTKDRRFFRRWNQSRNLVQPEAIERDGKTTSDDINNMTEAIDSRNEFSYFEELYPDWELTEAAYTQNGINHGEYIHYEMRRRGTFGNKTGGSAARRTAAGGKAAPGHRGTASARGKAE